MLRSFLQLAGLLLALIGLRPVAAQPATPTLPPDQTTAYRSAVVYAGPGDTYLQVAVLRSGSVVTIVERNAIGNWLHVQQADRNGFARLDGWVMTGYLSLSPGLRFSAVPVNTDLPDADLSTLRSRSLAQLYAVPVVSPVDEKLRAVYERGQTLGIRRQSITKIGDSLTFNPMYLEPFSRPDNDLGPYDYLRDALDFFGASVSSSVAAKMGLATYTILDPMWADKALCQPGETPLACEYRRKMPGIVFILFGPNDVLHTDREKYTAQLQRVVEDTLQRGIIPVLSTFSADPQGEYWWQAVELNLAIVEVADQYDVPLINLWAAARPLPAYGLDADHVHMKNSGFVYLKFSTGHESWYGTSLRNLLSLVMLDRIYHTIVRESEQ